ncbi:MAG: dihydrofolate reductase [Planctomycetes bacterium]|nr:dihydrofolate reductase [Planctomycetota bacterium]
MTICIIAAMSENRVIGRDGGIPWHLPEDLRRFRRLTTGHTVIMGRRTYESIGRPLPERRCIVLSRHPDFDAGGAEIVRSFDEALDAAAEDEAVFIAGGAEVYAMALPFADRMELTIVHAQVEGDTVFPDVDLDQWRLTAEQRHESEAMSYTFRTYERVFE